MLLKVTHTQMEIINQNRELKIEFNGVGNYYVTETIDGSAIFMTPSKIKALNFFKKASAARGVCTLFPLV